MGKPINRQGKCQCVILFSLTLAFRLRAKNIFLTYPRTPHDVGPELHTFLLSFPNATSALLGLESHANGEPHVHALLQLSKRLDIRSDRIFDFQGHHPNVQGCRSIPATKRYIKKTGNIFPQDSDNTDQSESNNRLDCWKRAVHANTITEYLSILRAEAPKEFILWQQSIQSFGIAQFNTVVPYQPTYTTFARLPQALLDYCSGYMERPRPERPATLYLCGPSRTGKTEWARSLGNHVYCHSYYSLEEFIKNKDCDYAVFDDIPYERFPAFKAFVGCQKEFFLTDKYRKKTKIIWGKPSIILVNPDMDYGSHMDKDLIDWWEDNTVTVVIDNKLY